MVRVEVVDDAPRNRSSHPAHVESFAEDVGLRDLVENLPLLIFVKGRQVDKPATVRVDVCSEACTYPPISPIHHLIQRQTLPVYCSRLPPYWQPNKYDCSPKRHNNPSPQPYAF